MAKKGDLLVTIKGDASQFNKTIESSTNQVRKFNSSANRAGSSVGGFSAGMGKLVGTFGRVAGPLGIAITAISTLNKAMNATETSSDFFANNIAAAGDSVTQFFVALQTGDFSNFDKGLTDIYKRAKDAVEALDQLGNTAKSLQFIKAFGDLGISDLMEDIFDSDNVKDQLNMLEEAEGIAVEIKEAAEEQQKDTKTVIDTKFASYGLPADLITEDRLSATFSLDAKVNKDQVKKEAKEGAKAYNKEKEKLDKKYQTSTTLQSSIGATQLTVVDYENLEYQKELYELQEKYADALVTDIALNKMNNDKVLFPMVDAYIKSAQDLDAAQKGVNQLQKTKKKINQGTYGNAGLKNTSSSSSPNLPTIFADGSMAKAEQEVQKYTKEVNEAVVGTDKWKEAQENLNKAQENLNKLEIGAIQSIQVEDLTYEQVQEAHKRILDLIGNISNKELREQFEKIAKSYEDRIKEMDLKLKSELKAQWTIARPTSIGDNITTESKSTIEATIKKLTEALQKESNPSKIAEYQKQLENENSKLTQLRSLEKRPSILTGTIGSDGKKVDDWVDFTSIKRIGKYIKELEYYRDEVLKHHWAFDSEWGQSQLLRVETELAVADKRSEHLMSNEYQFNWGDRQNVKSINEWLNGFNASIEREESILKNMEYQYLSGGLDEIDILNQRAYVDGLKSFREEVQGIRDLAKLEEDIKQELSRNYDQSLYGGWEVFSSNINTIDNVVTSIKSLDDSDLSGWEKFVIIFNALNSSIKATLDTIDVVKNISAASKALGDYNDNKDIIDPAVEIASVSAVSGAKIAADAAEATSAAASNAAIVASMIPVIAATKTLMATASTAAYAGMPFVGVGLATAQITSMNALIAANSAIPAFADGGIVYGNTIAQVGEYANASSNPEVIAPLSKLKNILAESGGGAGNVQFRIQGKELVGVLDNYSSIKRKR